MKVFTGNLDINYFLYCVIDGFGEKGKPAHGDEGSVPPNATLEITLELVSWKTVSEVTDDKKVIKKIVKEGEGYERPNDGAVVKCKLPLMLMMALFFCLYCNVFSTWISVDDFPHLSSLQWN